MAELVGSARGWSRRRPGSYALGAVRQPASQQALASGRRVNTASESDLVVDPARASLRLRGLPAVAAGTRLVAARALGGRLCLVCDKFSAPSIGHVVDPAHAPTGLNGNRQSPQARALASILGDRTSHADQLSATALEQAPAPPDELGERRADPLPIRPLHLTTGSNRYGPMERMTKYANRSCRSALSATASGASSSTSG